MTGYDDIHEMMYREVEDVAVLRRMVRRLEEHMSSGKWGCRTAYVEKYHALLVKLLNERSPAPKGEQW